MKHYFVPILYKLAKTYEIMGDIKAAERYYTRALEIDGDHQETLFGFAVLYYRSGNLDRAEDLFQQTAS